MPSSAVVFANRLGLVEPVVGHQGAAVREMPPPDSPERRHGRRRRHRSVAASAGWCRTGRSPPDVAADAVRFCLAHGLDPHLNHLERMIVQAGDPNFADYSAYLGRDAETGGGPRA